tara:strand:- start:884 stop:1489 length:606 start_codon:yes stop_codon:yes gene_type:complete
MGRIRIHNLSAAEKDLSQYVFKDLQRACLVRGMEPQKMVESDYWKLQSFYIKNYSEVPNNSLLDEYDEWFDSEMALLGKGADNPDYKWMYHPDLRLGFTTGTDEKGNLVGSKKPRLFKKPKEVTKKERRKDLGGIFAGTKKAMTMELAKEIINKRQAKDLDKKLNHDAIIGRITKKVLRQFPDANEKSIRIWYNKIKKELT